MGKEGFEPTKLEAPVLQTDMTLQRHRFPKTSLTTLFSIKPLLNFLKTPSIILCRQFNFLREILKLL